MFRFLYTVTTFVSILDYGQGDQIYPSELVEDLELLSTDGLDSILQKMPVYALLRHTAYPGDHFEVTSVHVTISNSNINWLYDSCK